MSEERLPDVMTPEEVARYLRLAVKTIRAALVHGDLPGIVFRRRWRVRRRDVDALFEAARTSRSEYPPLPETIPPGRRPGRPPKSPPPGSASDEEMAKWERGYVNRLAKKRQERNGWR